MKKKKFQEEESGIEKYGINVESLKASAAALGEATVGRKCNLRTAFELEVRQAVCVQDFLYCQEARHVTVWARAKTRTRGLEGNDIQKRVSSYFRQIGEKPPTAMHLIWVR
jgi:hypothetical protein